MCRDCGCSQQLDYQVADERVAHSQTASDAAHQHRPDHLAQHNRHHFDRQRVFCVNLMGAPGSGKTALLESIAPQMDRMAVIEGDLHGSYDRQRLLRVGVPALQIQTGQACHLEAGMIHHALHQMEDQLSEWLVIENVGNLACPADFDLGEHRRVVMVSVTEGDDKPIKYPSMFAHAHLMLVSKIDLLPHVDFNVESCFAAARLHQPALSCYAVSAETGAGLDEVTGWFREQRSQWLDELK